VPNLPGKSTTNQKVLNGFLFLIEKGQTFGGELISAVQQQLHVDGQGPSQVGLY
jgi:hypothetical protein